MFLKFLNKKSKNKSGPSGGARVVDGIDREMNYCPSCGEEFRSDIGTCALCEIPLISGEEQLAAKQVKVSAIENRSMEIGPSDSLVSIRKGPLKDIKMLQQLLAKERIPAVISGDESACSKSCCGPELYLRVKEQDLEAASSVLTRDYIETTALDLNDLAHAEVVFDHQAAETTCPACGCNFSPTVGACPDCGLCFE